MWQRRAWLKDRKATVGRIAATNAAAKAPAATAGAGRGKVNGELLPAGVSNWAMVMRCGARERGRAFAFYKLACADLC